jgi:hypothetical protein
MAELEQDAAVDAELAPGAIASADEAGQEAASEKPADEE